MNTFHVKKGDEVVILAGTEKGKRGKIIAVQTKKSRAIVEGCQMIKRHMRKSQQHPNGAIIEREGTIHISNLMLASKFDARAAKRGAAPAKTEQS
ncbi:MAG: 50S ribosomal protein L24 [Verrucomicrobia bacterium]|nr:50S ribosomal protein L24 [Verrucomicrobiota bacterium]